MFQLVNQTPWCKLHEVIFLQHDTLCSNTDQTQTCLLSQYQVCQSLKQPKKELIWVVSSLALKNPALELICLSVGVCYLPQKKSLNSSELSSKLLSDENDFLPFYSQRFAPWSDSGWQQTEDPCLPLSTPSGSDKGFTRHWTRNYFVESGPENQLEEDRTISFWSKNLSSEREGRAVGETKVYWTG